MPGKLLFSEAIGPQLQQPIPLLHRVLRESALKHQNNVAVVSRHQSNSLYALSDGNGTSQSVEDDLCLRWTYQRLEHNTLQFIESLLAHGVTKGMPIVTFLTNGIEYVLAVWAALFLGCPFVPLSPRALSNQDELSHMLRTVDAKVIVASDRNIGQSITKVLDQCGCKLVLRIIAGEDLSEPLEGWTSLSGLLQTMPINQNPHTMEHLGTDPAVILFTSGTTSLPKGCPHTYSSYSAQIIALVERLNLESSSSLAAVMPNNHAMGCLHLLSYLSVGGTVCFPGPAFRATSALGALKDESCTNLLCVPTMLHALLDQMSTHKVDLPHLRQVDLGGAAVSPIHLRQCVFDLGAQKVGTSMGMTEGSLLRAAATSDPETLIQGDNVLAGTALAGVNVRVCAPGSWDPLPLEEAGEIIQSGPHIIKGYMGKDHGDEFKEIDGKLWFRTGDQAMMYKDGNFAVIGRYKDVIIRGGENIAPASIERVLNTIDGLTSTIVGCKDPIAGELPIAVYESKLDVSLEDMRDLVRSKLGPAFVPGEFLTVEDLGLTEVPKLVSGKIAKTKLTALVQTHRDKTSSSPVNGTGHTNGEHLETVLRIWSMILGIPPTQIDVHAQISDFADSINIMRYRDKLRKETRVSLSLEDMLTHPTIAAQMRLFASNFKDSPVEDKFRAYPARPGPPRMQDLIFVHDDQSRLQATKNVINQALQPLNLTWDDVEDVMPATDVATVMYKQRRDLSFGFRHTFVTKTHDISTLIEAYKAVQIKHSLLRSILVRHDFGDGQEMTLHVAMRPSPRWFDLCVSDHGEVENEEELKLYKLNEEVPYSAGFAGPSQHALVLHLRDVDAAGLILISNHSPYDALAMRLAFEDLDRALGSHNPEIYEHIPYKFWADTYYTLRSSLSAKLSIQWHAEHLAGIASHAKARFPPQRAPEWLMGSRCGWSPSADDRSLGLSNSEGKNLNAQDGSYAGVSGVLKEFRLPNAKALRDSLPGLTYPVMVKAAVAILNVQETGHTHALFHQNQASRSGLPFMPEHLSLALDVNCADVAGPCWNKVVTLVSVEPQERLGAFLLRLQEEQTGMSKHEHAPILGVAQAISCQQGARAGDIYHEALRRQVFNWVPGGGAGSTNPYENMRAMQSIPTGDIGLVWWCGMGGDDGVTLVLRLMWDDANVLCEEAERWVDQVGAIMLWMTNGELGDKLLQDCPRPGRGR